MQLARLLRAQGRAVDHCRERGIYRVPDYRILARVTAEGRAFLTNDHDFILLHGAWLYWSELWGVPSEHPGILLLEQGPPAETLAAAVVAFENLGLPLRGHIYEWTKTGGWSIPKGVE